MNLLHKLILTGAALGLGAQQSLTQPPPPDATPNGAPTAGAGLWTRYHLSNAGDDFARFRGAPSARPDHSTRGSSGLTGLAVRYRLALGEDPTLSGCGGAKPNAPALDVSAYLTVSEKGEPALKGKLTLRESQGGIAGTNVTELAIEPNGAWAERRFSPFRPQPPTPPAPTRSGTLTGEQLTQLANALAKADFATLPAENGRPGAVNPHGYEISFGDRTVKIHGLDGATGIDAPVRERLSRLTGAISTTVPAR